MRDNLFISDLNNFTHPSGSGTNMKDIDVDVITQDNKETDFGAPLDLDKRDNVIVTALRS